MDEEEIRAHFVDEFPVTGAVRALVPSDVGLMIRSRSISKLIVLVRVTKRHMIEN